MQRALANGRAFLLLAAVLTVTRAGSETGVPALGKSSTSMPGLPATLNPRPASDLTLVRWGGRGTPDQAVKTSLTSPGWCWQDHAVTGQLVYG